VKAVVIQTISAFADSDIGDRRHETKQIANGRILSVRQYSIHIVQRKGLFTVGISG
jgi:hypothetical protein